MPLRKNNTRHFHRMLYAGQIESVTLLKRDDDQRMGVITKYKLFECRWSSITKTGEIYRGDWTSDHKRTIFIPRTELDRVGVNYISAADRFVDKEGRSWQPESDTPIDVKLFEGRLTIECHRADPPPTE